MKFCQDHWTNLRKAIDDRGLTHLVAQGAEEAADRTIAELQGRSNLDTWDPLMSAYWNLSSKVLERVGLAALAEDFCPMCAVQESYNWYAKNNQTPPPAAADAQRWIDSCCDVMLKYAQEKKLVTGVQ